MVVGLEGEPAKVRRDRAALHRSLRAGGAVTLGRLAGSGWEKGRFHGPYLREALLDRGLVVETFETAQQWSSHGALYHGIRDSVERALSKAGMAGTVMCHLSHAYRDGASLYFTVIASAGRAGAAESWIAVKSAAAEAIQAGGGTVSHHHATGRDHTPWLEGEIGPLGIEALKALKGTFDPTGIMNPGCLVPVAG
jgi:alkyldihydroxyacetonephosphate synthase